MKPQLPESNKYVKLSLLNGGSMTGSKAMMHAESSNEHFRLYDWAFYIYHPGEDKHVMWDVGLAANKSDYTPFVRNAYWDSLGITAPSESIPEQISRRHGILPSEINSVIFSHAHFDHCYPTRDIFLNSTGYFGPGTKEFCSPGHFQDPESQWDGRFFDPIHSTERWETLSGPWVPLGCFEKAMDFFGDGSFWVIQAPGHMPGNLCACARLENGEWVLLGSDCCHSRSLLDGTEEFAEFPLADGSRGCLHMDLPAARETVAKLREMERDFGVHVALAHDVSWMVNDSNETLTSLVEAEFLRAVRTKCPTNSIL